ncbi:TPA: CPBP family intramembrane metalloprotease [Streptococcus suis]|nr:CPBP family intramembrane metalloprotease [Streptococcus suis]
MKRVKNILKFIGLIFVIVAINITPMRLIAIQDSMSGAMKWVSGIGYLVIATAIVVWTWKRYKKGLPDQQKRFTFTWKDFGFALLFFLAGRVVGIGGTLLTQLVTGNATTANDAALLATNEQLAKMFPLYFVAFHIAIGVFAPFMEELVFRGLFSSYFFKENQKWLKLIISSAVFALLHAIHPIELPLYFLLGAVFYLAYARRGNIVDAILVHILNNSLLVIFSIIGYLLVLFG